MNFLPAVPARHVAAFREGESVAATHIGDRPFRPPDAGPAASLPAKQSIRCKRGRPLAHRQDVCATSLPATPELREGGCFARYSSLCS